VPLFEIGFVFDLGARVAQPANLSHTVLNIALGDWLNYMKKFNIKSMDGQKSEELSENGENSDLETEFTNKPSGSKQVDGSSYVGDQVHCTEPKNVFPSEVKFDTSGNVSNASARGRYMLAKLRQQQLKEELELDLSLIHI
jgi:hypothetical protein